MIWAGDLEADGLLHEITKIHCFGFNSLENEDFFVFCRLNALDKDKRSKFEEQGIQFFELDKVTDFFKSPKVTGFSIHNGLNYDLEVIKMFYGIDYDWRGFKGYNHTFEDTYVNSMYLHPDRQLPKGCPSSVKYTDKDGKEKSKKIGPHGLESWGWRTGTYKPFIIDWRDQPLHVYVDRIIEDCKIQKATHFLQQKEINDVAIPNGSKKGQWKLPLKMAHKTYWLMSQQEKTGVCFNVKGAKELIIRIDKEMKKIEDSVEPKLGSRVLPLNQQPEFPKSIWKKPFDFSKPFKKTGGLKKQVTDYLDKIGITENQEDYINSFYEKEKIDGYIICKNTIEDNLPKHPELLTESAKNYCEKFGIEDLQGQFNEVNRILCTIREDEIYPKKLKEPMRLANQNDVKLFFINKLNWEPTLWRTKNLLVDLKTKQNFSKEKQEEKIQKYILDIQSSPYKKLLLKELGYKKEPDYKSQTFYKKIKKMGRFVPSSPQLKDIRGNLCPNLEKLEADMAKKIVLWLSLRNRRTTIKSFDKNTGWLNHERLKQDGRLPGSSTGLTNTKRQKHHIICNIPAASDSVVLGKEVRDLFISPAGYCCIGADCSGIEGRCMGEAAWNFDNGEFANIILNGDVHQNNADAFSKATGKEVSRGASKSPFYAGIYGCNAKKQATLLGVDEELGDSVNEALWKNAWGLKKCKDALEEYWESTGKKYIMGITGEKVYTRSKHSLLNAFLQNADSCLMDWACCYIYDKIKEEELDAKRWIYYHDEVNYYNNIKELSYELFPIDNKPEEDRNGKKYSKPKIFRGGEILHYGLPEDKDPLPTDQWIQHYSRVGEICVEGMKKAGQFFNFRVPLDGQYICGGSWGRTH